MQLIEEFISIFNDRTIKKTILPIINATKIARNLINFTIEWVRSLDPVRC